MKRLIALLTLFLLFSSACMAQMKGGTPVQVSHKVQVINGKRFMVHVVEQGQTVYAIARAYGLKEVEAVTKKDVHFLQIGDTVWLPCRGQKMSDGTVAPPASVSQSTTASSQPAQGNAPDPQSSSSVVSTVGKTANAAPAAETEKSLGPTAVIRPRVNPNNIVVSLMMPLNLSQMDKISTSKFDVEQRGKISYKSLEFIQFYEGLLLGLDRLEQMGYNIVLNVVDVEGEEDADVEKAFRSHNVAQSDILIAMLTRRPFHKAASLARDAQLFIVNPVSDRAEILDNNPYVFKCMPSSQAYAKATVSAIRHTLPTAPIYIVHSNAKNEKTNLRSLTDELDRSGMTYSLVDWAASAKFTNMLRKGDQSVVISLYDQDKTKNRIYVSQLLNKLSAIKTRTPYLFTFDDWSATYSDVDFAQLQNLNYHTFNADWNMSNPNHKDFVDLFRQRYKTEPTQTYAGMANDIILYFVCGLQQKGTDFFRNPVIPAPKGMLYPLSFSHIRADNGFENQFTIIYRMTDYHFTPVE